MQARRCLRDEVADMARLNQTALITGATSGIGKAFAQRLAKDGYNLIITGRRKKELDELAEKLSAETGTVVKVVIAELSDEAAADELVRIAQETENLSVLVNNAGFGTTRLFHEEPVAGQAEMVKCHVLAPLKLMHAAIPGMVMAGRGTIINVSSLRAFIPGMTVATYSGTKSFLNMFSMSVAQELSGAGVKIQALCPGYTLTDFHARIGVAGAGRSRGLVRWMSADEVVDYSLRCLSKDKVICVPGAWNRFMITFSRLVPHGLLRKISPGIGGKKPQ